MGGGEGWYEREGLEKRHSFSCLLPLFLAPFSFHATREKVTASAGQFFVVSLEILYGVWYFEGQNML